MSEGCPEGEVFVEKCCIGKGIELAPSSLYVVFGMGKDGCEREHAGIFSGDVFDDKAEEAYFGEEGDDPVPFLVVLRLEDYSFKFFFTHRFLGKDLFFSFGAGIVTVSIFAPIAQSDRVPGFEPGGYRFKSCSVHFSSTYV